MAFGDLLRNLKEKAVVSYRNFFYEGKDAPPPRAQRSAARSQEQMPLQQEQQWPQPGMQQGYQQPAAQGYAAAYQQPYQQYGNPAPQQSAYAPQQQPAYAAPQQEQPARHPRFPRTAQHAQEQPANNVVQVDFANYQKNQQPAFTAPQQESAASQSAGLLNARIINARSMGDCRSAITLLRNGDAVLIVMENITNPGDMRRLVDTLSGACYSLTATITKVSRYGVYLLAPQTLAVFADQTTNMMNSVPTRGQPTGYQPNYSVPRTGYAAPQGGQPAPAAQAAMNNPYAAPQQPQSAFTQRTAIPEAAPQNFYQQPTPQDGNIPSFTTRPSSYGYAPDEAAAVDQ